MGTITINVDETTEKRFRKNVKMKYGQKKGSLGKAVTEALDLWNQQQVDLENTIKLLDKRIERGGYTYQDRGELHARN